MSPLNKKKLGILRKKLDNLDNDLIKLIKKRTTFVSEVLKLKEYKSEFSSYLKKEFSKLDIKTKRELFKAGLLKVKFSLNYLKYAKMIEEGKVTGLESYVFARKDTFPYYLNIKYNDETLKELKNIKEQEKKDSKSEDTFRDIEIKDLEEEIKEKLYDKEEWFYNDDDEEENY